MSDTGPCVLDSITDMGPEMAGKVIVAASHGAVYAAALAASRGARAVILNDAGGGRDGAGRSGLDWSETIGMAAATVDFDSARIGDGADMMANGTISAANAVARGLECVPGLTCSVAASKLAAARQPETAIPPEAEVREVRETDHGPVVIVDSAGLVRAEDAGKVIVTGSHGGVVRHRSDRPLAVRARFAVFSDAGGGKDAAGISRLPALADQGIAAATASVDSAGIGSGRAVFEQGVLSHVNPPAEAMGIRSGMTVAEAVALANRFDRGG